MAETLEIPKTSQVVQYAMKMASKNVKAPKVVRQGLVKTKSYSKK